MISLSYSCILGRSPERATGFFCCHSSCIFDCFWQLQPTPIFLLELFDQKSALKNEVLTHITATGIEWIIGADGDLAPEYIMMDHSIGEQDDCTMLTAMADIDLKVGASLLKDGIRRERCCAFDVMEHFHVVK